MKRLRTILILLFAAMMSLCLFACGGDEDQPENPVEPEAPAGTVTRVRRISGLSELTDSAEQADIDSMLANVKITIERTTETEDLETVEITAADCDIDGKITPHEVGDYELTFKPRDNNPNNRTITATATVVHDWGAEENLVTNCKYCGARRERNDKENVVIHYGTFHQGIDAVVPDGYEEKAVYTNKGTDSRISEFGEVNGRRVPTLTAGTIEKGETITIRGTAKTATGTDSLWTVGGEPKANEQWNSPNLGIADRLRNVTSGYLYGTSVIVRQEGWVLYNGIGDIDDATNTLASIMGGSDDGSKRTSGWRNYGSHLDATETPTPTVEGDNYEKGSLPTDWSTVPDWYVYSDGPIMQSGTFYLTTNYIEYSWTYREDNVIEIRYANYEDSLDNEPTVLKAYIKVPDSLQSGYDTILHGDYNDMTITETEFISKNTPKQFTLNGIKSGAQSVYAENMMFDASTVDLKVEYEQRPGEQSDVTVTNTNVYAYVGNLDYDALKANEAELTSLDATKWVSLASNRMLKSYKAYKVQLTKGGKSCVELFAKDAITVIPNKVADAVGAAYGDFELDETVGTLAFSLKSTTSATDNAIVLTLGEGYAKAIPQDKTSEFSGEATAAMKYISLRLNATDLATSTTLTDTEVSIKKEGSDTAIPSIVKKEGNDVYLVLALTEAGRYVVTGVQKDTPVILDLSALKGFNVDVAVTNNLGALNTEGTFTLTYTIPADWTNNQIRVGINGGNPTALGNFISDPSRLPRSFGNGFELTAVSREDGSTTLTLTFKAPAANLEGYQPVTVNLEYNGAKQLVTYLDWEATLDASAESMMSAGNGYYASVPSEHTLKAYYLDTSGDLQQGGGKIRLNINDGNEDNFKANGLVEVEYSISADGRITVVKAPSCVTDVKLVYRGTYGDSRDTDKFALIVLTIDATQLGLNGDYYFNFANDAFNYNTAPATITKVSGTTISDVNVDGSYSASLYSCVDGDCYTEGLYAWKVEQDNKVVFFANAGVAGGSHLDDNSDGKCDLCGGEMTSAEIPNWASTKQFTMQDGDIVEMVATYTSNVNKINDGYSNYGIVWTALANGNRYWTLTDGQFQKIPGEGDWDHRLAPYDETERPDGEQDMWTSLPYNVLNGVVRLDGNGSIDTTSASAFKDFLAGTTIKYTASYTGGVLTVVTRYYKYGLLAFEWSQKITVTSGPLRIEWTLDPADNEVYDKIDGPASFVHSARYNSQIGTVEAASVGTHEASTDVEFTKDIDTANGYAVIKATGAAKNENGTYYVAFKVPFTMALVKSTRVIGVYTEDGTPVANATATLNDGHDQLDVYLPITGNDNVIIRLANYEASTMQANIKIDLTNVSASNVQATVNADSLTIGESTFTIQYTNAEASDTVVIGSASKTLTELKAASDYTAIAEGVSAKITGESSGTVTVEFKKAAANLEAVISSVEIRLERAGKLLARSVIEPALEIGSEATQIESGDWYVKAVGTKLYLLTNDSSTSPSTVPFNVNAGSKTKNALLGVYELAYTVKGGAVSFNETNALTKAATAVYSEGASDKLVVIIIDLTSFGVEADTPYGYALETSDYGKWYKVDAERTITDQSTMPANEFTLSEADCTQDGIAVKGDQADKEQCTFFDSIVITKGGHKFGDDNVCTVCKEVSGWTSEFTVGKSDLSSAFDVTNGTNQAYNPETKGTIVRGQKVVAEGVLTAKTVNNWDGIAVLIWAGATSDWITGTHLRIDNWINEEARLADYSLKSTRTTKLNGADTTNWTLVNNIKAHADVTVVWDWPVDSETITITITAVGIDTAGTYVQTYEITSTDASGKLLRPYYSIGIAPDSGYFYGTITATASVEDVPGESAVPANRACQHSWNPSTHKCDWCLEYNTDSAYHTANGGQFDNGVCSVCDWLDPSAPHTHHYVHGVCSCTEVCPHTDATHEEGCSVCGATWGDSAESSFTVNHTAWFGQEATVSVNEIEEGGTYTYTAKYEDDMGTADWRGAMFKVVTPKGFYGLRYTDSNYINGAAVWATPNTDSGETISVTATGFSAVGGTNSDAATYFDGKLIKVVVTYTDGTVTVAISHYAATDTQYASAIATSTYTFSGVTGTVSFGITDQDGSHFVNDTVNLVGPGWTWAD